MKSILLYFIATLLLSLNMILGYAQNNSPKKYRVKLKLDYELNKPGDSIVLSFYPHETLKYQQIAIVDKIGICSFELEQEFPFGQIIIEKFKKHKRNDARILANRLYWEEGDDIALKIKENSTINDYESNAIFSGKGAEKYTLQYKLREELRNINEGMTSNQTFNDAFTDTVINMKSVEDRLIAVLNSGKGKVSQFVLDVLKTDILMLRYEPNKENISNFYLEYAKESPLKRKQLIDRIYKMFAPIKQFPISEHAMSASSKFQFAFGKLFFATAILRNNQPDLKASLKELEDYFPGLQKESVVLSLLKEYGITKNQDELTDIKKIVKTFPYYLLLNKLLGQKTHNVYGYTFIDTSRKLIDLEQFKGKYLLIDFWFTGCGACAVYYQNTLSKIKEEFKDHPKFAVLSISADRDFNKWLSSIPLNRYTNIHTINLNTGLLGNKHKFSEDIGQWKYPFIILVDPNGNIVEYDTNSIRTTKELLRETLNKYLK